MNNVTRKEITPGVHLTSVHTSKFKSSYLAVSLLTPLSADTASANALVPMVLHRGTERYPDMESLAAALDDLYGGSVEPMNRKKGETQCVGFAGNFLDDAYTPDGSAILERAAELMGELLLRPATENGGFVGAYFEGERQNLIDSIRAQVNDKRQYASRRIVQLMCQGEAYGVDRLGSEESAAGLTIDGLWAQYKRLLASARLELYYCGSAEPQRVEDAFRHALEGLERSGEPAELTCQVLEEPAPGAPREFTDSLDVTQGKLSLGFRCGVTLTDEDYPAMHVFNALYGATTTSKLFLNVREKLSLCYYASSQYEKFKGLILVSSGVEFDKRQEAQDEILAQLEACKQGTFEPWELEAARRSAVSATLAMLDSQSRTEDFWLGQSVLSGDGPEEIVKRYEGVTAEQVVAAANKVRLDAVYFLKGKENQSNGQ